MAKHEAQSKVGRRDTAIIHIQLQMTIPPDYRKQFPYPASYDGGGVARQPATAAGTTRRGTKVSDKRQVRHPLREVRRFKARKRTEARAGRSAADQMVELAKRPGNSERERARLRKEMGIA